MLPRRLNGAARLIAILLLALPAACGAPRDPEGSSKRIAATRLLRVGVSNHPPAVIAGRGFPAGSEPDLIRGFARRLGSNVAWTIGSETQLVTALEAHQLDIVAGGFDRKSIWATRVGSSRPYASAEPKGRQPVLLVAPGENALLLALDKYLAANSADTTGSPQ